MLRAGANPLASTTKGSPGGFEVNRWLKDAERSATLSLLNWPH